MRREMGNFTDVLPGSECHDGCRLARAYSWKGIAHMDTDRLITLLRPSGIGATRFDRLARSLTAARTRRETLVVLAGGSLGLLSLSDAAAKRRKRKRKKGKGKGKPKDQCAAERVCADDCCDDGEVCQESAICCPAERVCAETCCDDGQVCQDGTTCCTEDVAAFCESRGVSCGTHFGPCGRNVNCGDCPSGSICPAGACCRDLGRSCGPSAGGAECCSGRCGPTDSTGNYTCRFVDCVATGSPCRSTSSTECCEGTCRRGDGTYHCAGV